MRYTKILEQVMNCDPYVRFAVITDMNGNKIDSKTRVGSKTFLPEKEMDLSIQHAINSWKFRNNLNQFVGKGHYVIAVYDKVRRVTMPIRDGFLMLVAFDNEGGQNDIVDRLRAIVEGDYTKPITRGVQN